MSTELKLMIRLSDGSDPDGTPPVVVCRGAADTFADSLPKGALLVFRGDLGWVASDSNSGQIVPLGESAWSRLGEWELRLTSQGDADANANPDPYAAEYEGSILENNSGISGWLIIHDQAAEDGEHRRAYLPTQDGSMISVGRSAEAKICLRDKSVSRQHLRMTLTSGRFWMENLGKYAPTVNGRSIEGRTRLSHGDTIGVGKSTLIFNNPAELADARANPPSSSIEFPGFGAEAPPRDPRLEPAPSQVKDPLGDRPHLSPIPSRAKIRIDPVQVALAIAIVLVVAFIVIALQKL